MDFDTIYLRAGYGRVTKYGVRPTGPKYASRTGSESRDRRSNKRQQGYYNRTKIHFGDADGLIDFAVASTDCESTWMWEYMTERT